MFYKFLHDIFVNGKIDNIIDIIFLNVYYMCNCYFKKNLYQNIQSIPILELFYNYY